MLFRYDWKRRDTLSQSRVWSLESGVWSQQTNYGTPDSGLTTPDSLKMLRPGCALPFTSGPPTRSPIFQLATEVKSITLVTAVAVSDLVSVDRSPSAGRNRTNDRALLTGNEHANGRRGDTAGANRFVPKEIVCLSASC
jgi:hypothetical protein